LYISAKGYTRTTTWISVAYMDVGKGLEQGTDAAIAYLGAPLRGEKCIYRGALSFKGLKNKGLAHI